MSPTVKNPCSRPAAVLPGSPEYSKSVMSIFMYTTPGTPGGQLFPSSSATMIWLTGQAVPTVPGWASQSCGVASVPPPSVAA